MNSVHLSLNEPVDALALTEGESSAGSPFLDYFAEARHRGASVGGFIESQLSNLPGPYVPFILNSALTFQDFRTTKECVVNDKGEPLNSRTIQAAFGVVEYWRGKRSAL